MFLLFTTSVGALLPKRKILFEHARRLGSRDYFDVIYSTYRLVYNMDECILPRAEVPRNQDIVPLPPCTFLHQNRAFFLFGIFSMYIKQISIAFIPT